MNKEKSIARVAQLEKHASELVKACDKADVEIFVIMRPGKSVGNMIGAARTDTIALFATQLQYMVHQHLAAGATDRSSELENE